MKSLKRLATEYSKNVGDDCLCGRTQPGTPFGECIYIFCGCDVAEAYEAGFRMAREMALEICDNGCGSACEKNRKDLVDLGEEDT